MRDTHINEKGGMAKRRRSLTHDNVTPFAVAGEKSSASRGAQDGMGREQEEMKEGGVGGGGTKYSKQYEHETTEILIRGR